MFWHRLKYLNPARRHREEREMREELDALAELAPPGELGNLTLAMENARETWRWSWLDSTLMDVRYALRTLRRQPAFCAVAVLSLALAIGGNSAIFSLADAMLLRPLPVSHPAGLLDVSSNTPDNPFEGVSFPDYRDLRTRNHSFAGLAAYRLSTLAAATDPAAPARVRLAALVSDNYLPVVGIEPSLGRAFLPAEAAAPGQPVALITYDLWQQQYAAAPSTLGRTLRLNGIAFTIIGVTPESFTGLDRFAHPTIYIPLAMAQRLAAAPMNPLEDRGRHDLVVKGRLLPSATLQSASAELAAIGAGLEREYPKTNARRHPAVRTELDRRIQQTPQLYSLIKMLMGLVTLILIIAGSNLASLLLARARARSREIAIRLSIGAGQRRLVRQLMTESIIIALCGAAVGLAFAYGGILLLQTMNVPSDPPSYLGVQLDWRIVRFSLFAALVTCVLFGLAPAWRTVRMDFLDSLKGGDRASGSRRTLGRDTLVVGQIALASVVLIVAGMFLAGFRRMVLQTPDFRVDHMISMDTAPALLHYTPEQTRNFYRELVDRIRLIPGVESVAMTESLPLSTSQTTITVVPENFQFPKGRQSAVEFGGAVDANYFRTLNVDIVHGRAFTDDDRSTSRRVAIVNQQFAKNYWPNQNAIGKRLRLQSPDGPLAEVVGIAKTGHYLLVNEPPAPYVYVPYEQNPRPRMTVAVQAARDAGALAAPLREAAHAIDANLPVFNLRTVATLYESRATGTWLQFFEMVGSIALIGLVLAITGLYGLIAYTVNRRVKEFGIRVALGATHRDVVWMVERRGLILSATGVLLGAAVTLAVKSVLTAAFPDLGVTSPLAYISVALMLLAVSSLASYIPARRAAALDPLRSLHNE
jgi:predicted permease